MGQAPIKFGLTVQKQLNYILVKVKEGKIGQISELKTISFEKLVLDIQLLNYVFEELFRAERESVQFSLKDGGIKNLLWKATNKVLCEKVEKDSGKVVMTKMLSIPRFMTLYSDIMHQMSAVSHASDAVPGASTDLTASMFMERIIDDLSSVVTSECCVCMDRAQQVILACSHGYCESCFHEWKRSCEIRRAETPGDTTCPLCRYPVSQSSDLWYLAEGASADHTEMSAVVLGLLTNANGKLVPNNSSSAQTVPPLTSQYEISDNSQEDGFCMVNPTTPTDHQNELV